MRDTIGIEIQDGEMADLKKLAIKRLDTEELMEGLGNKPQSSNIFNQNSGKILHDNMN